MQTNTVACPLCHGVFALADTAPVGKSVRCQKCGAPFTVAMSDLCSAPNGSAQNSSAPRNSPAKKSATAKTTKDWPVALPADPDAIAARDWPVALPATPSRETPPLAQPVAHPTIQTPSLLSDSRLLAVGAVVGGLLLLFGGFAAVVAIVPFKDGPESLKQASIVPPADNQNRPKPDEPDRPAKLPQKAAMPEPPRHAEVPEAPVDKEPPPPPPRKPPAPKPGADAPKRTPAVAEKADRHGVTPTQQKKIDDAISRGVQFIKNQQLKDGSWTFFSEPGKANKVFPLGPTALAGLTLLECGVPTIDPRMVKTAKAIRTNWASITHTYEISLNLLFLDRFGDKKDKPIIQALALRLIAGQDQTGGWAYDCPILTNKEATALLTLLEKGRPKTPPTAIIKGDKQKLPASLDKSGKNSLPIPLQKGDDSPLPIPVPKDGKISQNTLEKYQSGGVSVPQTDANGAEEFSLVAFQQKGQKKQPPPPGPKMLRSDNSNTQFAMLALWAARRHGVPVERALAACERRFRSSQFPSGHWGYHADDLDTGYYKQSMTCVGLLGIALGKGSAEEMARLVKKPGDLKAFTPVPLDDHVRKGLNALRLETFQVQGQNYPRQLSLYFVWSVERIGVLYDLTKIGGGDWYQWGVGVLLPTQFANGAWDTSSYLGANPLHDTCFALLFLKRVNLAQDLTELNIMGITDPNQAPKSP